MSMRKAIVVLVVVAACGVLNVIEWHFGGEGTRGFPLAWVTYLYAYDAKINGDILVDVVYHPVLGLIDVLVVVAVARWVGGIGEAAHRRPDKGQE